MRATVFVSPPPSRNFETWDAAMFFAQFKARRTTRRQRVRLETGLRGLPVWAVREVTA